MMKAGRKRILLVGNQILSLKTFAQACRNAQFSCIVVPTSEYILEKIEIRHYDLLVLDLDLKRKPHIDLVQAVDQRSPYTPIVLVTKDYVQSQDLIFSLDELNIRGSWQILEKPFNPVLLAGLIEEILLEEDKGALPEQMQNSTSDQDKRAFGRRAEFQPIRFSYERLESGSRFKIFARGLLTDIGAGGMGLLTNRNLSQQQMLSFENKQFCGSGHVAWSARVDDLTRKVGISFR